MYIIVLIVVVFKEVNNVKKNWKKIYRKDAIGFKALLTFCPPGCATFMVQCDNSVSWKIFLVYCLLDLHITPLPIMLCCLLHTCDSKYFVNKSKSVEGQSSKSRHRNCFTLMCVNHILFYVNSHQGELSHLKTVFLSPCTWDLKAVFLLFLWFWSLIVTWHRTWQVTSKRSTRPAPRRLLENVTNAAPVIPSRSKEEKK